MKGTDVCIGFHAMSRPRPDTQKRRQQAETPDLTAAGERLQKVLAAAGIGSRRECEELITEGRVDVDREVVTELGTRVDPTHQQIRVDGVQLTQPKRVYYILNKPPGVVSTNRDPDGRPRVIDLIHTDQRLFSIGRLDRTSEGLIICTNDGDLAYRLTHPKFGVEKRYIARVVGRAHWDKLSVLREGIHLSDGFARVSSIRIRRRFRHCTDLEIVLDEGRNREIRRLLAKVGHKVVKLKRVSIGPLPLGDLPQGAHRQLTQPEVKALLRYAESVERSAKKDSQKKTRRSPPRSAAKTAGGASAGGKRNSTSKRGSRAPVASGDSGRRRAGRPVRGGAKARKAGK